MMTIQLSFNKANIPFNAAIALSAFEKGVSCDHDDLIQRIYCRDWDEWFSVFFHALSRYSKTHTWSEVTQRRFFTVGETGVRFWMQAKDSVSVSCARV